MAAFCLSATIAKLFFLLFSVPGVETETKWPLKPKVFAVWPITERKKISTFASANICCWPRGLKSYF